MNFESQKPILAYRRLEAARALGLSARKIDYMIEQGQLKAKKVGKAVLIPTDELYRLLGFETDEPNKGGR